MQDDTPQNRSDAPEYEALPEYTWDDVDALQNDLAVVIANPHMPDCPIVYVNDAFLAHSGYERDEIVGRNCRFMQGPDSEPEAVAQFRDAIASGSMADIRITNYRKDGAVFINQVLLRPLHQSGEEAPLVIAVQRRVGDLQAKP
ncbi:MAG: PAS domain-containing protein [Pseudomonadota bacterium]